MRGGAKRLMKTYPIRACGYCPKLHKRAQTVWLTSTTSIIGKRDGRLLDDLIPPRYVWHVPDINKPLQRELRNFYGQAPAVVEICVHDGACVPEQYKPTMRLDVRIPTNVKRKLKWLFKCPISSSFPVHRLCKMFGM
ncbi:APO protein 2 [Forsythia ovata]|uniref:APO protein 2 n=1 Tax=Forsythia ovata TaxID=205694 RepID=A0ABD1WDH7_9LAMI